MGNILSPAAEPRGASLDQSPYGRPNNSYWRKRRAEDTWKLREALLDGDVEAVCLWLGIDARKEDVRFIIDVVGKNDPWFEQGASALVFASRFRNFVIAQCQESGMNLSTDEIDLIDAWFAGGQGADNTTDQVVAPEPAAPRASAIAEPSPSPDASIEAELPLGERTARWWQETANPREEEPASYVGDNDRTDEFPRIVRNRLKA